MIASYRFEQRRLDMDALQPLIGKRVRLTARVTATRDSEHLGDQALGLTPSTPEVGDVLPLGVGTLVVGLVPSWDSDNVTTSVGLEPDDGRQKFWLDPDVLYRLHNQTVELCAEETDDPCHPKPRFEPSEPVGFMNPDGSFQVVCDADAVQILPKVTRHGPGLFTMSFDYELGESMMIRPVDDES